MEKLTAVIYAFFFPRDYRTANGRRGFAVFLLLPATMGAIKL